MPRVIAALFLAVAGPSLVAGQESARQPSADAPPLLLGVLRASRRTEPPTLDFARSPAQDDPAVAAAAKIQGDQAAAATRWAAVRFLGTVDPRSYPEAEAALIEALRTDRVEAVRVEAVRSLARLGTSSPAVLAALNEVLAGKEQEGQRSETSERVATAALEALRTLVQRPAEKKEPAAVLLPPELRQPGGADDVRTEAWQHVARRIGAPRSEAVPAVLPPPPKAESRPAPVRTRSIPAWLHHDLRPIGTIPERP